MTTYMWQKTWKFCEQLMLGKHWVMNICLEVVFYRDIELLNTKNWSAPEIVPTYFYSII